MLLRVLACAYSPWGLGHVPGLLQQPWQQQPSSVQGLLQPSEPAPALLPFQLSTSVLLEQTAAAPYRNKNSSMATAVYIPHNLKMSILHGCACFATAATKQQLPAVP